MANNKKTVPLEEAREQVRKVSARLGLLHIAFAKTLVDELGEKKGKELILKAIKDYGVRIGEEARAAAAAKGLDNARPTSKATFLFTVCMIAQNR